jgi:integrating conjugative element protein (TIGR03757 family)
LLVTKSAIRPGSNFNRQGGSIFHQRQHAELIKTRRHSPEWQQLQLQLRESADGVVKAWVAGVTKVPATTVDNKYVVYGMTDVGAALQKIRTAQGEQ